MSLLARRKNAKNQNVLIGKVASAVAVESENNFWCFSVFDVFSSSLRLGGFQSKHVFAMH